MPKKRKLGRVSLAICSWQIERNRRRGIEVNFSSLFIDLLEVQAYNYSRRCLIEVMSAALIISEVSLDSRS